MRAGPAANVRAPSTTTANCVSRKPCTTGSMFVPPRREALTPGGARRFSTSPIEGRSASSSASDSTKATLGICAAETSTVVATVARRTAMSNSERPRTFSLACSKPSTETSTHSPDSAKTISPEAPVCPRAILRPEPFCKTTEAPGTRSPPGSVTTTFNCAAAPKGIRKSVACKQNRRKNILLAFFFVRSAPRSHAGRAERSARASTRAAYLQFGGRIRLEEEVREERGPAWAPAPSRPRAAVRMRLRGPAKNGLRTSKAGRDSKWERGRRSRSDWRRRAVAAAAFRDRSCGGRQAPPAAVRHARLDAGTFPGSRSRGRARRRVLPSRPWPRADRPKAAARLRRLPPRYAQGILLGCATAL